MPARREDIYDDDVQRMHELEGMMQQENADYYGVSRSTIYYRLHIEEEKERAKQRQQSDKGKEYMKEYRQTDKRKEYMK